MRWAVTPLRVRGRVPWLIRPECVVGELVFISTWFHRPGSPNKTVYVRGVRDRSTEDLLPELNHAEIVRLDSCGLTLEGVERLFCGSRIEEYPQTWRCEPVPTL